MLLSIIAIPSDSSYCLLFQIDVDHHISETESQLSWKGGERPDGMLMKEDAGKYECQANGAGDPDSRSTILVMNCKL